MYYEDLTAYAYYPIRDEELIDRFGIGTNPCELRLLNFGWLNLHFPFEAGDVVRAEVDKIAALCLSPNNLMRGFHQCHFCDEGKREFKEYTDSFGRRQKYHP